MRDKNKEYRQPVIAPNEAWHLGRLSGFREAVTFLGTLKELEKEVKDLLRRELQGASDDAARSYCHAAGQGAFLDHMWRDLRASFDESLGLPIVERRVSERPSGWGIVDMQDGAGGQEMLLATPFRNVDPESLPAGTRTYKIHDPRHGALAAIVEVLVCAKRDIGAAKVADSEDDAIRRHNRIIFVYHAAATAAIAALDDDDYVRWKATSAVADDITRAPEAICEVAATRRGQCALALQLVAVWLQAVADQAMNMPSGRRMDHVQLTVDSTINQLTNILDATNRILSGVDGDDTSHLMVLTNPATEAIPLLAVIPKQVQKTGVVASFPEVRRA